MLWLALACVIGQGGIFYVVLRYAQSISQLAHELVAQRDYETEIHQENRRMMKGLLAFQDRYGTAQNNVANFVEIPPDEERSA